MITNDEVYEKLADVEKKTSEAIEKLDKARNSKLNGVYDWFVKLFSLVVLLAAVYTAVIGLASSSFVLTILFLFTWFMYLLAHFALGLSKGVLQTSLDESKKYGRLR